MTSGGKMKKAKVMCDSEFGSFLNLVKKGNYPERNAMVLVLSFKLGLRAKELASLNMGDIVGTDGEILPTLELVKMYTKGEKHRSVPLSNPKVIAALRAYVSHRRDLDGEGFNLQSPLFKSQRGTRFSANSMAHMIRNLFINNGKVGYSSHSGRRSLITKLVNNGVSINKVQSIAGHSSIGTTMEYVDTNPDDLATIMKNMG